MDVLEDRKALLAELQDLEAAQKAGQEVSSDRLSAIYAELEDIDADAKPAAAAEILHGLGFTRKMQEAPTKSFSGGWRMRLALAQVPTLNKLDIGTILNDFLRREPAHLNLINYGNRPILRESFQLYQPVPCFSKVPLPNADFRHF